MWKRREDETPQPPPAPQQASVPFSSPITPSKPLENRMENFRSDMAHIGKSVVIKGELSGSEDLYVDGEVEGKIELNGNSLTVGPNGRVRANVQARGVVIHGRVDGNLRASDRVELKKTAVLNGDIVTQRIAVEDGAFFKGSIDIQKQEAKPEPKPMAMGAAVTPSTPASPSTNATGALFTPQASLTDKK